MLVIIGYGTVKREDANGSVQTVSSANFNRGAITGPQELLAGKVAGVTISTDGNPGGGSSIRIRGESSISASNDPLIVIDGVAIDNGAVGGNRNVLNIINPNDIETFTVLKDASAAAIYGNRASGGVILITTKKGTLGSKMAVSYSGNVSVGVTRNRLDILNAQEVRDQITQRVADKKIPESALELFGDAHDTDWQDENFTKIMKNTYAFTLLGGILEFENGVPKSSDASEYMVRMVRVKSLDNHSLHELQHIPEDSDHYREAQQFLGV